ncbi:hypothetical protein BD779DRAFT_1530645 [Infundibulicybe gibba]|nr:hypothetical protein BD779DRAFT_1530645 [Infundibulicybe gibba]
MFSLTSTRCKINIISSITIKRLQSNTHSTSLQFPSHPRPTPHQIFHLPPGASQQEIKARYYDLVRIYHPDSPQDTRSPLSTTERHARFHAIGSAYDILRGKPSRNGSPDIYAEEIERRKRAYHAHYRSRPAAHDRSVNGDDRWKDRVIIVVGLVTLAAGLVPSLFLLPLRMDNIHRTAAMNLSQAREDAKELGEIRRNEVRKRVMGMKSPKEPPSSDSTTSV